MEQATENSLVDLPKKKYTILYVDDEPSNLRIFKTAFKRHYNVFATSTVDEGMEVLKNHEVHLIVTDQKMPQMTGVEFLAQILPDYPNPVRMILTGFSDVDAIIEAINSGRVFRYITKPWNKDDLKEILDNALLSFQSEQDKREALVKLKVENKELQSKISELMSKLDNEVV